jgi:putative transposase
MIKISKSVFYAWCAWPEQLITADKLSLYRQAKVLFKASRDSLGSRELSKTLNETSYDISRYRTIKLMNRLKLKVKQRIAYKVTTEHKHSDKVASNVLNQNFNPRCTDEIWAGDITYLKTAESWMYLSIVMNLHSRCIVGWQIETHMATDLISKAPINAVSLRQPKTGLVFNSARGS